MVFGRFAGIISAAASRFSAGPSSTVHVSSGLSPEANSFEDFGFASSGQKSSLRLSSSLQDLSAYRRLDPEEGNLSFGIDSSVTHAKPPHLLQRENAVSSFSKEKAFPGTPLWRKKWPRMIMFLLCLVLFTFLIYMFSKYFYSEASKYYVVLDCGSTGTRVYVYQASIDHKKDGNLPITLSTFPEALHKKSGSQSGRAYNRMETEPGFDKLVHNVSGLRTAIKPLLQWAEKQIPKHAHKSTSVFLYATAGVRRLPSADSEWLLNNAWSIMKNSPFLCQREWVKTITGMEEAYYGWIALNYLTGMLGAVPRKPTFGALDLGGSSLQVTFESKEHLHNETSLNIRIGAINHHLNAYSLSGYGLNDAFGKSVVHLLKKLPQIKNADLVNGKIELKHPCLQSGYKEQYNCLQCAAYYQESGSPMIAGKKLGKGGKPGIDVKLLGAPNWDECSALAKVAVNLSEWSEQSPGNDCELQPCALNEDLPRPFGQFYAMSGFFVVYRFFNLTSEATLDDILEKGREFCEKNWEVARKSVSPQPFIEQYCFRAPYIVLLLREGLHIVDDQVIIGSGSITWTLGVALLEAGNAFSTTVALHNYELFRMKINPIFLFAIMFISLLSVVCAISCVGNGMPRFFRRPYIPLFRHNNASSASVLNIPSPFRFQRWSPMASGDGRVKLPLSPTIAGTEQGSFGFNDSGIQLMDSSSSIFPSSSSVSHSYSSGSLGQIPFDSSSSMGSFWSTPHRSQMRLQSRRSQSREDLNSSLAEV